MLQDIIVVLLLIGALSNVIYQASKYLFPKKGVVSGCGGCSECGIKKTLTNHAR